MVRPRDGAVSIRRGRAQTDGRRPRLRVADKPLPGTRPSWTGRTRWQVGRSVREVQAFFGFTRWPDQVVHYDLGQRRLEVTGIPGHHAAWIAVYDDRTGLLFTGDSVCPGRIYVADRTGSHRFGDFVIYNGMGVRAQVSLAARGLACRAWDALRRRGR